MDAALNPKARPTARERCASAFSSEALRIFLGVVLGGAVGCTVAALCPEDRCAGVGPSEGCAATAELLAFARPETMVNVAGDSFAAVLAQLKHGDDLPAEAAEDPPPKAREST